MSTIPDPTSGVSVPPATNHFAEIDGIDGVRVGALWKRNEGREVVRVERAWLYGNPDPEPTVRAHPTHGGRPLVAPTSYLREHYTEVRDV